MLTEQIIQITALVILILLSGFFSSAETALSTITDVKIRTLVETNVKGADKLLKLSQEYSKMLSAILIGNNIVNITASAIATNLSIELWGNRVLAYVTGVLTLVILIFGEIIPKNAAKLRAERFALSYAPVIRGIMLIFTPVIYLVDAIAKGIMWVFGINEGEGGSITEAELRTYVDASHEEGVIESGEKVIINNLFDFSDSVAKEIMIPAIDMQCVENDLNYDEVKAVFKENLYTRLPVYENERDNIIGLINIKDFMFVEDKKAFHISDILREGYYTYEYKKTADLMMELRDSGNPLAFVISEYGACVGMVTLEDLLEEIVGEIRDEYDEEELENIRKVEKNVYILDGKLKIDDVNDALSINLDSEEYDSIAGLILEQIDRIPEEGDEVSVEGDIRLKVNEVLQNRITKVRITLPEKPEEDDINKNKENN